MGNSGVHIPHGMSYSVAGLVRDYCPEGYPLGHPLVPHGISVIVNAPAAFRFTAPANPERHRDGALLLGAQIREADQNEVGDALSEQLEHMMKLTEMPNGISDVGYDKSDLENLAHGAFMQQRLLANAPCDVSEMDLENMYSQALRYW